MKELWTNIQNNLSFLLVCFVIFAVLVLIAAVSERIMKTRRPISSARYISVTAICAALASILMLLGLYYPMTAGIAAMEPGVIIPFLLGIVGTVIMLARGINALLTKNYGVACHCIIGFVIASTIPIIPTSFRDGRELIFSIAAAVVGFAAAYLLSKLDKDDK